MVLPRTRTRHKQADGRIWEIAQNQRGKSVCSSLCGGTEGKTGDDFLPCRDDGQHVPQCARDVGVAHQVAEQRLSSPHGAVAVACQTGTQRQRMGYYITSQQVSGSIFVKFLFMNIRNPQFSKSGDVVAPLPERHGTKARRLGAGKKEKAAALRLRKQGRGKLLQTAVLCALPQLEQLLRLGGRQRDAEGKRDLTAQMTPCQSGRSLPQRRAVKNKQALFL